MEPRTAAEPPHGAEEWARRYEDDLQPQASRQRALRELITGYTREVEEERAEKPSGNALALLLQPMVTRLARMIARGMRQGDRDEFIDEAVNLVVGPREESLPRICGYREDKATLPTWLSAVLGNLWRSRYRTHRPTCPLDVDIPSRETSEKEDCSVFDEEFSQDDLRVLAKWKIHLRIGLLCLSGLWVKVPEAIWESWLAEYERHRRKSLDRPFPRDDFLAHDDHKDRMAPLAQALGVRKNTLAVHWRRAKERRLWEELSCL